jgi:hypothetical protein
MDTLSKAMQDEIIRIATERLGRPLSPELIANVREKGWSYRGLEWITELLSNMDASEIEGYLSRIGQ